MNHLYKPSVLCILAMLYASGAFAADTLLVYTTSGINGSPPIKTLTVFDDNFILLEISDFNSSEFFGDTLTDQEVQDLVALFENNNFAQMDSIIFSGCLSCPDFSITYGEKTVWGNTTSGNDGLAAIIAALDSLVERLTDATDAVPGHAVMRVLPDNITAYGICKIKNAAGISARSVSSFQIQRQPGFFAPNGRILRQ